MRPVRFHRIQTQIQQIRDLFIALALGHQLQHLALARGSLIRVGTL